MFNEAAEEPVAHTPPGAPITVPVHQRVSFFFMLPLLSEPILLLGLSLCLCPMCAFILGLLRVSLGSTPFDSDQLGSFERICDLVRFLYRSFKFCFLSVCSCGVSWVVRSLGTFEVTRVFRSAPASEPSELPASITDLVTPNPL